MNPLKANFSQNQNVTRTFCIEKCKVELNNEHIVWCKYLNKDSDIKYKELLNGNLMDKIEVLRQAKENEKQRSEENNTL